MPTQRMNNTLADFGLDQNHGPLLRKSNFQCERPGAGRRMRHMTYRPNSSADGA
jgi:hypothetical protein